MEGYNFVLNTIKTPEISEYINKYAVNTEINMLSTISRFNVSQNRNCGFLNKINYR